MADYEISAEIKADSSGFEKGIKTAQKSMNSFSANLKTFSKSIGGGVLSGSLMYDGLKLVTKGLKTTIDQVKKGVKEFEQFNKEQRLLAQTLEVTGASTWTNIDSLNAYADALQETTNYSGGEINQLQTVLLGFKNITGQTFNKATDAIVDMASVMNMDLTSATQAVAKALDDPIKGINSLSRQGFIFTEQQKSQLEIMVQNNDIIGAQNIILEELATTYGGAAKASAKATTQLKNNWTDVLEQIGRNVTVDFDIEPAVKTMNTLLTKWKDTLSQMADAKEKTEKLYAAEEAQKAGNATTEQQITLLEREKEKAEELLTIYKEQVKVETDPVIQNQYTNAIRLLTVQSGQIQTQINAKQKLLDKDAQALELAKQNAQKAKEKAEAEQAEQDAITKAINNATEKIKEQELQWKAQEQTTGVLISTQEKLTFYQDNLVDAIVESKGLIGEENEFYLERIGIIDQLENKLKKTAQIENNKEQMANDIKSEHELNDLKLKNIMARNKLAQEQSTETTNKEMKNANDSFLFAMKLLGKAAKYIAKGVINIGSMLVKTLTKAIKSAINIFKKLIDLNLADATDKLLEVEDKILTFFYVTLPKLPSFVQTVFKSIGKIIKNLVDGLDREKVAKILKEMFNTAGKELPGMIDDLSTIIQNLIGALIDSLSDFIANGGLLNIANALFTAINTILNMIFVQLMGNETIKNGIAEVLTTALLQLPTAIDSIMAGVINFVDVLFKAFVDWVAKGGASTLATSLVNAIINILDWIIKNGGSLIESVLKGVTDIIVVVCQRLPELLPKIMVAIVEVATAVIKALLEQLPTIIIELLKSLPNLFVEVCKAIWKSLVTAIKGIFSGIGKLGKIVWNALEDLVGAFATGTNNASSGLALVGEQGPELVDLHGGERIYTAQNTKAILEGTGNGGNSFNVTFNNTIDTSAYAMMKQLKSYNRQMAINGVL